MKKRLLSFVLLSALYLSAGVLLQQCVGWNCGKDIKDYQINNLDWVIGNQQFAPANFPDSVYISRDSLHIHARLLDFNYVEIASLFQLLPTALACDPRLPESVQKVSSLNITLLDSVQLADGAWLVPSTLVSDYFDVYRGGGDVGTASNFPNSNWPNFYSTYNPLSLNWNKNLAGPSFMRLRIKLVLSDGKSFETPANQPLEIRIY